MKNTAYKPLFGHESAATSEHVRKDKVIAYLQFIAANTRRWRLKRGLTQESLAEAADLDLRFIQRIERGTTNLSVSVLIGIADALEIAPTALFREAKLSPSKPGRPRKQPEQRRSTREGPQSQRIRTAPPEDDAPARPAKSRIR